MKFTYEDLISGDSIPVQGVGHLRSPKLSELRPTHGIGIWKYNFYINAIAWDKDNFLQFFKMTSGSLSRVLEKHPELTTYDVAILIDGSRSLLQEAMGFFIDETLSWDEDNKQFLACANDQVVGVINRENFEDVRDMMLQMNYISIGDAAKPEKFANSKAQELWEKTQKYLKSESVKAQTDKTMNLGNIISKICAAGVGYTLLNVYDLTIFQLYDQFFQLGYMRAMNINDMAYSNHGGDKFDMKAWLKPIINF